MNLGLRSLLLIGAIVCFALAAIGVAVAEVSLTPLGLALLAAASLFSDGGFRLRT
jgi:hypothetical protein